MNRIKAVVASLGLAAVALPAVASAAPWQSVNARQHRIDARIDQGVRSGALTRFEARQLRGDFRQIVRLESRYRHNGLTAWERRDLDRRLDSLSARVRIEKRDRHGRR